LPLQGDFAFMKWRNTTFNDSKRTRALEKIQRSRRHDTALCRLLWRIAATEMARNISIDGDNRSRAINETRRGSMPVCLTKWCAWCPVWLDKSADERGRSTRRSPLTGSITGRWWQRTFWICAWNSTEFVYGFKSTSTHWYWDRKVPAANSPVVLLHVQFDVQCIPLNYIKRMSVMLISSSYTCLRLIFDFPLWKQPLYINQY